MLRDPVDSSCLASIGYDHAERLLEVEFRSGWVYRYFDVPNATYEELRDAGSKGRYLNAVVKREGFRYHRVR